MIQIPLSFAVPWNFSAEDIYDAREWLAFQWRDNPDDEGLAAAYRILSVILHEYRTQCGEDPWTIARDEFMELHPTLAEVGILLKREEQDGERVSIERIDSVSMNPAVSYTLSVLIDGEHPARTIAPGDWGYVPLYRLLAHYYGEEEEHVEAFLSKVRTAMKEERGEQL